MSTPYDAGSQPTDTTYCNFTVGQHVVCLKTDGFDAGHVPLEPYELPQEGKVYTVRRLEIGMMKGQPSLTVKEIPEQRILLSINGSLITAVLLFEACNFRPLQKLKVEDFLVAETPVDSVPA